MLPFTEAGSGEPVLLIGLEPSSQLQAVWEAEAAGLDAGEVDAAVNAIIDGWTLPDAPAARRQRVVTMQRRAFEREFLGVADG